MALKRAGTRVASASVTFANAFQLGRDRWNCHRARRIDTHDDVFRGAFDPVFVATSVDLVVEHCGGTTTRMVQPSDLSVAIALDQARSDLPAGVSESLPTKGWKADAAS